MPPVAKRLRVGLFVTCLVDLFRPTVGFAAVKLLEDAGCVVEVPEGQTCCGQPAYNNGDVADAKKLAQNVIATFEGFDRVVVPSGSCAGMIVRHYPTLFEASDPWRRRAEALAAKTHELVSFLTDVLGVETTGAKYSGTVTYHDSCSGLRELGIREQPRKLLKATGAEIVEMKDSDVCCGFGGTFSVKYPEISGTIVDKKAVTIEASGAETLVAGDLGCLVNMAGRLSRRGARTSVRHVAEILAGMADGPAIGETRGGRK